MLRMRFTPDGRTLVTSGADGEVIVWDVARGEIRRDALRPRQADRVGPRHLRRRAHRVQRGRRRARVRLGPRRRPQPRPAVRRRPRLQPRRRRHAPARARAQPGWPHARRRTQRRDRRPPRRADAAPRERAFGRCAASSPRSPSARRPPLAVSGRVRAADALGRPHAARARGELKGQHTTSQALAFSPDGASWPSPNSAPRTSGGGSFGARRVGTCARARRLPCASRSRRLRSPSAPTGSLLAVAASQAPTEVRDARSGRLVARSAPRRRPLSDVLARRPSARHRPLRRHRAALVDRRPGSRSGSRSRARRQARALASLHPRWLHARHRGPGRDHPARRRGRQTPIGSPLTVEPDSYLAAALSPDSSRLFAALANRAPSAGRSPRRRGSSTPAASRDAS